MDKEKEKYIEIGFIPRKLEDANSCFGPIKFKKVELLEFSMVKNPVNPACFIVEIIQ